MDETTLKQLIDDAEHGKPILPDEIVNIEGFSSPKVRRLLNSLCAQPGANYLEIGVHIGSTFIPALYGNKARATCIDSWKMFDGAREQFRKNVDKFLPLRSIEIIDGDCWKVAKSKLHGGYNVYFYDGDHTREAQRKALIHFASTLAHQFVLLVDDCNWEEPREETKKVINDLGWKVLYSVLLPGAYNGDAVGWWNGLYVGLIEK